MQDLRHPLGDLPDLVLDNLMDILSSQGGGSGIRATCRMLHKAFDAHNTALVLGGRALPIGISERRTMQTSEKTFFAGLAGLMHRTPRLKRLKLQTWFHAQSPLWSLLRCHPGIQHLDFSNGGGAGSFFQYFQKIPVDLLHLDLSNTCQLDIFSLSHYTSLRHLSLKLCMSFLGDLDPLKACVNLQHLDLGRCENVRDLSPLQACVELQYLDVRWTGVTNLAPLASCKDMRHLNIRNTPVESLGPLAECTQLQHLNLCQTAVSDMQPLAACGLLQHLDLGGTGVRSLVPLKACRDMQHLDLSECQALEGQCLVGVMAVFTALRHLDLRGSNVLDLNPRDLFKSIKGLNLKV